MSPFKKPIRLLGLYLLSLCFSCTHSPKLPVIADGDVVVVGGGPAGVSAAYAAAREVGTCIVTGQAAGTAAALSVLKQTSPARLSVTLLQSTLRNRGVRLEF